MSGQCRRTVSRLLSGLNFNFCLNSDRNKLRSHETESLASCQLVADVLFVVKHTKLNGHYMYRRMSRSAINYLRTRILICTVIIKVNSCCFPERQYTVGVCNSDTRCVATIALYSVILSVLDPRKCEYLKEYSLDFEHAYMTTYLAS